LRDLTKRAAPQLIQDEDCEAGGHGPDHATGDATDPRFPTCSGGNWILWKERPVNLNEALRRNAPSRSRNNEDQRIKRNEQPQPIDRTVPHQLLPLTALCPHHAVARIQSPDLMNTNDPHLIEDEDCEAGNHSAADATGITADPRFPPFRPGDFIPKD
jgi:hypothetical protein